MHKLTKLAYTHGTDDQNSINWIKRKVLSEITNQLYDPAGLVASKPIVVLAKICKHILWKSKLIGDDNFPLDLKSKLLVFHDNLKSLNKVQITRPINTGSLGGVRMLHEFCHAPERAYGAALYIKHIPTNGPTKVSL